MLTAKTTKLVLKAQACIDQALQSNRLKAWEQMPLLEIRAGIDKFVRNFVERF